MSSGFVSTAFFLLVTVPLRCIFKRYLPQTSLVKLNNIMEKIKQRGFIAHRGGMPENTITAFHELKGSSEACAVEVDLQFSKDGHPVLFHDRKVDRVSDQSGNLADLTLDQIKSLDVGHKFGYPGARVPTLTEGVEAIKELDLHMFLEIKRCDKHGINMLAELFQQDPSLYDQIIVISFYPDILYKLKLVDPNIVIGLLIRGTVFTHPPPDMIIIPNDSSWKRVLAFFVEKITNWLLLNHIWKILGTQVLLPHKEDILNNRFDLEHYRKQGIHVITWTVNATEEQNYFHNTLNLTCITDNVPTIS